MITSAIVTGAITFGASMISAVVRPMVDKAMEIKDKVKHIMVDKAKDFLVVDEVNGIFNIERDIAKLQTTLGRIEEIVQEAEEMQIGNVNIQNWLRDLVDIAYEARDVLDDFITFSSCVITAYEETSNPVNFTSSLMLSYFAGLSSDTSEIPLTVLNQLEKDIRSVTERFDEKIKKSETFKTLKSVVVERGGGSESVKNRRPIVGPSINKQRDGLFLGREEVKQRIMEKILHPSDDNDVHVVAIWGMGGIGKTTLAKSIYNDERVKEDYYPFKNRRWLCVGENKLSAKEIITKIIGDSSTNDVESLQKKLVEKFKGNRFLIVLDDVWDVDRSEWKILSDPLTNIGKGGVIILTTRRSKVITATNTLVPDALRPLSPQDSWSIFESCAFIDGNADSRPDLKRIGKKIVEKLKGLPLALEVVGRSLLIEKDTHTWTNFLDFNEWKLKKNDDDLMPALRWSYNHLPSNLKQCFAYCALFPKDHVYDEKALVEMWMAHDLISNIMEGGGQRRPEDVGAQYFKELIGSSLLQLDDDGYVMHDMIHDLALLVSKEEFLLVSNEESASANSSLPIDIMEKVRHIAITPHYYSKIPRLCKSEKLLTLYTICSGEEDANLFDDDIFKQLKSIRVLVLCGKGIKEIRDCISKLKHLRYLDVSQTSVKSLPDSLCDLYHLRTLAAPLDAILPRNIVNMVNLRHLRANITTYEGIAKLTSLQELSSISVCEDGCISELGYLRELHGKLEIHGLENVTDPEDAAKAWMQDKIHIDELRLVYDVNLGNTAIATNVLDALQCPPNLTSLTIDGYSGNKCPNWMTSGKLAVNLQRLGLHKCHNLKLLPPLGELNSLKHLFLESMNGIERLGVELYGKGINGKVFFPSLISIHLDDMKNWKEWDSDIFEDTSVSFFPCLRNLLISKCPKLVSILPPLNAANVMRSLYNLDITGCHGLELFKLDGLISLKYLVIKKCSNLACITPSLQVASTIKDISISICKKLKRIDCESLPSLTDLSIIRCDEIVSIPHLVRIKRLDLNDCRKLRSLTIGPQGLVSLTDLDIEDCPLLESTYEEGSTSSSLTSSSALPLSNLQDLTTDNKRIFTKLFNHELVSIVSISIRGFNGVEHFGDIVQNKWRNLNKFFSLFIFKCKDLKSLSPEFHNLPSLKVLHIYSCPHLESLPAGGLPDSLESLKIGGCPLLFERCKDENGPDWDKIKHVSDKEILLHDSDDDSDDQIDYQNSDGDSDDQMQIDDHSDDDSDDQIDYQNSDGDSDDQMQIDDHSDDDQLMRMITYEASMISAVVRPMVDKAMEIIKDITVDRATDNIEREISNLQKTLGMIEGMVPLAEEKQIENVYIQNWLRDLVDIGYEARDVLDDFITFSSCVIAAGKTSNPVNFISAFMLSYFGGLSDDTSKQPLAILIELEKDIRGVRERFDEKKKEGENFWGLRSVVGEGGSETVRVDRRPEVGPYLNQQADNLFLGREEVKEGIMEKILRPSDDRVDVVVIWGMGGIGKTTLAQSIYNDERVKEVPRTWFCVGENKFSAEKVIKEIVNDQNTIGIGKLQEKLVKKLRGDRFLIVLDDVLDVYGSEWDLLFNSLTEVGKGGLIIITIRERELCAAINIQTAYHLKHLSEEDSWLIFESCAFIDGKSDTTLDLKRIGKEIVKKLNGLPLALKVVGRSLLNRDSSTWTNFLESNQRKFRKNDGVMSSLRKSYNHLPPHLKTCFTYCTLFPKDHVLDKKVLVEMWMAHDLIQKEGQERPEDVGAQYFEELVNASLLQCVNGKYVMHDMIHDLALFVSNEEFATANGLVSTDQMERVRHISITPGGYLVILSLRKIEKLLTLYTICSDEYINWFDDSVLDDVFKQLKSIRVLVLSSECIYEIPDCISELKHLRYLDVSKTRVKSLPDSLCHLYNLQMLAAPCDAKLPRDIVNISSLRYVRANLSTCKGVGKLTSLQELSSISVCRDDNIRELGYMQQLRGKLTIKGLENVTSLEDHVGAWMDKQTLMDQLELVFNQHLQKSTISAQVLDALGCPPNLTYLRIAGYNGLKPPNWMLGGKNKFDKLQTLELYDCPKLKSLPPLGELTSLKHLFLWKVGVKRLGDEFYGKFTDGKVFFPSLESLSFILMTEWEEWDDIIIKNSSMSFFPHLSRLEIDECPKLASVLPVVKNRTSKWKQKDKHPIMNASNFMTSLSSLKIWNCDGLERLQISHYEYLKKMDFERLPSLKSLDIRSCDKLISIPCLLGIKFLYLTDCKSLTTLCINDRGLDSLEYLLISDCPVLELTLKEESSSSSGAVRLEICTDKKQIFTKLFQGILAEFENSDETEANKSCKLRSLKSLCISRCKDLMSLPEHFYKLLSLNSLKIENFPKLQSLPPDFHKFTSLKRLEIISCPQLQSLPPDFHALTSLNSLKIVDCSQLQSLPAGGFPPSMKSLELLNCPLLYERCKDESGFDWHKIKRIPKLTIFGDHKVHRYGGDR